MFKLAVGGRIERTFVLTRVTIDSGEYAFHARYQPAKAFDSSGVSAIAPAVLFKVGPPALYKRDEKGILLESEAIRIVAEAERASRAGATAKLIRNEAGFLEWWVTVVAPAEKEKAVAEEIRSFLVNPYTGRIRAEVNARPSSGHESS